MSSMDDMYCNTFSLFRVLLIVLLYIILLFSILGGAFRNLQIQSLGKFQIRVDQIL